MLNLDNVYQPGSIVEVARELWTILTVEIVLRESDNPLRSHDITQMLTLLAVDADGNDLGKEPIRINVDMHDIKEI